MRARSSSRGVTLIEALIALAALAIGTAGVSGLIGEVAAANRQAAFQNSSLDAFVELASQVKDAACDVTPTNPAGMIDPGLQAAGWISAPVPGSAITLVGPLANRSPPIEIAYMVTPAAPPPDFAGPPAFELLVQICEKTKDQRPCTPGAVNGYWVRTLPLQKTCSLRLHDDGRGEFY